jgi:hypothetical protein
MYYGRHSGAGPTRYTLTGTLHRITTAKPVALKIRLSTLLPKMNTSWIRWSSRKTDATTEPKIQECSKRPLHKFPYTTTHTPAISSPTIPSMARAIWSGRNRRSLCVSTRKPLSKSHAAPSLLLTIRSSKSCLYHHLLVSSLTGRGIKRYHRKNSTTRHLAHWTVSRHVKMHRQATRRILFNISRLYNTPLRLKLHRHHGPYCLARCRLKSLLHKGNARAGPSSLTSDTNETRDGLDPVKHVSDN